MRKKIKVMIADDHPVVTGGMKRILELEDDIVIVATCNTVQDAMDTLQNTTVDIALIDLNFNEGPSGLHLVTHIRDNYRNTRSIIFSMFDERIHAKRAIEAGASGYVMKHLLTDTVIEAIRKIYNGKYFLSEDLTSSIISEYGGHSAGRIQNDLTVREFEVLRLIGSGKSAREIAQILSVSVKTVESYKFRIKDKLSISSSAELLKYAVEYMKEG